MKIPFSVFRADARNVLNGSWSVPVFLSALVFLMTVLAERLSSLLAGNAQSTFSLVSAFLVTLILSLLLSLLAAGMISLSLTLLRHEKASYGEIMRAFRQHPDKYLIIYLIRYALLAAYLLPIYLLLTHVNEGTPCKLPLLLFWGIAGLMILLALLIRWEFAPTVLMENPELSVSDALRESARLTRGQRLRLFVFELSFIGWYLLGILSFMLGFLWIMPYITASRTSFYKKLRDR